MGVEQWSPRNNYYHRPVILLIAIHLVRLGDAVKCYCTDDHCVPYGSCDGSVCLVGILRDSNQVIRTCGSTPIGCHSNEDDKWTDLCACDQPFCNTFAFLRSHTRRKAGAAPPPQPQPSSSSTYIDSSRHDDHLMPPPPSSHHQQQQQPSGVDVHHDAPLVFHRMDRPDDGRPPTFPSPAYNDRDGSNKTSLLTLLLVVVPLTVGAATVMNFKFCNDFKI
ncbi:unnamed protein product [Caenorhabditis bovis]|uniref:Activin types I and II receptor domain-containing protein n=1 Tax=Caenorhabditis bovis TaxID=2654633 RepID=A0A8S1ERN3_9PELO|nr:unnamed protein product [Caenorhabditis bovis]